MHKKRKIFKRIANAVRKTVNIGLALASLYGLFIGFTYIQNNEYQKGAIICGLGLAYVYVFLKMNPQLENMN